MKAPESSVPNFLANSIGFIQGHFERDIRAITQFKSRQAENVAIHHRHALQGPVFRVLLDQAVDFLAGSARTPSTKRGQNSRACSEG